MRKRSAANGARQELAVAQWKDGMQECLRKREH